MNCGPWSAGVAARTPSPAPSPAIASGFIDYKKLLRPGERASVLCLAVDKAQASIVEKYTRAYFADVPLLRGQVTAGDGGRAVAQDRGRA